MIRFIPFIALLAALPVCAAEIAPKPKPPSDKDMAEIFREMTRFANSWALVEVAVSESGSVTDVKILAAYPPTMRTDVFVRDLKKQRLIPGSRDGLPAALSTTATLTHTKSEFQKIGHGENFAAITEALREGTATDETFAPLRLEYDEGKLNLLELAQYFKLLALWERQNRHYDVARETAREALSLSSLLGPTSEDFLRAEEIYDFLGMGRPDDAVDYYDHWRKIAKRPIPEDVSSLVEKTRLTNPGHGRAIPDSGL